MQDCDSEGAATGPQGGLSGRGFLWRIIVKDNEAGENRRANSMCTMQETRMTDDRPGHEPQVAGVAGDG